MMIFPFPYCKETDFDCYICLVDPLYKASRPPWGPNPQVGKPWRGLRAGPKIKIKKNYAKKFRSSTFLDIMNLLSQILVILLGKWNKWCQPSLSIIDA